MTGLEWCARIGGIFVDLLRRSSRLVWTPFHGIPKPWTTRANPNAHNGFPCYSPLLRSQSSHFKLLQDDLRTLWQGTAGQMPTSRWTHMIEEPNRFEHGPRKPRHLGTSTAPLVIGSRPWCGRWPYRQGVVGAASNRCISRWSWAFRYRRNLSF